MSAAGAFERGGRQQMQMQMQTPTQTQTDRHMDDRAWPPLVRGGAGVQVRNDARLLLLRWACHVMAPCHEFILYDSSNSTLFKRTRASQSGGYGVAVGVEAEAAPGLRWSVW